MENQLELALKSNKLFKNINISNLNLEDVKGKLITLKEGELLFKEGDAADSVFLVVSGEINTLKKNPQSKTQSSVYAENEFFGEDEVKIETERKSTAVALMDSYLISLSKEEIQTIAEQDPEFAYSAEGLIPNDGLAVEPANEINIEDELESELVDDEIENSELISDESIIETPTNGSMFINSKEESPNLSIVNVEDLPEDSVNTFDSFEKLEEATEKEISEDDIVSEDISENVDEELSFDTDTFEKELDELEKFSKEFDDQLSKLDSLVADDELSDTELDLDAELSAEDDKTIEDVLDQTKEVDLEEPKEEVSNEETVEEELAIESNEELEVAEEEILDESAEGIKAEEEVVSEASLEVTEEIVSEEEQPVDELVLEDENLANDDFVELEEETVTEEIVDEEVVNEETAEELVLEDEEISEIVDVEEKEPHTFTVKDLPDSSLDHNEEPEIEDEDISTIPELEDFDTDDDFDISISEEDIKIEDEEIEEEVAEEVIIPEDVVEEEVLDEKLEQEIIEEDIPVEAIEENVEVEEEIADEQILETINEDESFEDQEIEPHTQLISEEEIHAEPEIPAEENLTFEHLELLLQSSQLINSNIQTDEVLKNIVDVAVNLSNADRGTLYLVNEKKEELVSEIILGDEVKEIRLKLGEGLAGWVALNNKFVNNQTVTDDPRFSPAYDKLTGYITQNMLTFPIRNKHEKIIGVLQLLNKKGGTFTVLDEKIIEGLSNHAAIALENTKLLEKLLESERDSSLGKMSNFLENDIKKPILVSKRYIEHLSKKELPKDVEQIISMLVEQLAHVSDMVQTTTSYADESPILRPINVSLKTTLENYSAKLGSIVKANNCEIVKEFEDSISVKLDTKEFYQCFYHLVKNASEAMPQGGKITVSTKTEDGNVLISFKDSGLGIPESLQDKIFGTFMTHGKKDGAGLGLSISKKIVEEHGGRISVESNLGEGTTFIVSLPVVNY